jgi:hypothetical protein
MIYFRKANREKEQGLLNWLEVYFLGSVWKTLYLIQIILSIVFLVPRTAIGFFDKHF